MVKMVIVLCVSYHNYKKKKLCVESIVPIFQKRKQRPKKLSTCKSTILQ